MEYLGSPSTACCTTDHAKEGQGVDALESSIGIAQEKFLGYSLVISMGRV